MRDVIDQADGVRARRESGARRESIGRFGLASVPAPLKRTRTDASGVGRHYERLECPGSRSAAYGSDRGASARSPIPNDHHMENPSSTARRTRETESEHDAPRIVRCSFCTSTIRNTPEDNAACDMKPYPFDKGVGACRSCGGDPKAKTDEGQLGCVLTSFIRARVPVIAARLSPNHRSKFLAMPLSRQAHVVHGLLKRGAIKW